MAQGVTNENMSHSKQRTDTEAINEPPISSAETEPETPAAETLTVDKLAEELAQARAEAAEYLDNWRRATAELSNARKRMLREQADLSAMAAERVLEALLPVADDMERAFAALPLAQADSEWVKGFRLIQNKLQALLESEDVKVIAIKGQMFDPELHHAITHEEAEGFAEGQIIAEVARGYKLHDKVLRPSLVRVAREPTQS